MEQPQIGHKTGYSSRKAPSREGLVVPAPPESNPFLIPVLVVVWKSLPLVPEGKPFLPLYGLPILPLRSDREPWRKGTSPVGTSEPDPPV